MAALRRFGVSQRVLTSAVLSVVVAVLLLVATFLSTRSLMQKALVLQFTSEVDLAQCEAAPQAFGYEIGAGFSLYAYDLEGRARNPVAPPLEMDLLARLQGPDSIVRSPHVEQLGGAVAALVQVAPGGDCAVLRVAARPPPNQVLEGMFWLVAGGTLMAMLLVGLGSYGLVVRPMLTRVSAISASARGVGEKQFLAAPEQLDDALGDIARVLEESHARIQEDRAELLLRQAALEEHLAGIAHDLRTPLSSMQLSLEALASHPEQKGEGARDALSDVVYLSALVENLHQGVRLRHGLAIDQGQVELQAVIARLGKRFEIIGRHAGVSVAVNLPEHQVWVACVPSLAERAVANLVQNAVGHNRSGGHVAVVLSTHDGHFEISVLDDGPGLPQELIHSLQNPSFSEDAVRQRGPGLGMLITREIALKAHWTLDYETQDPCGLRVRLRGPLRES